MNRHDIKIKLKKMSASELRALFEKAELEEEEKWLLKYYLDDKMVLNTCRKLNMSESRYHRMLPVALTKVHYTLKFN